jgi:hypothetical protein
MNCRIIAGLACCGGYLSAADYYISPSGPAGFRQGSVFRFQYRKAAPELSYEVQSSTNFGTWPATGVAEQSDGNGLFWRNFPISSGRIFVRLAVEP